MTVTKIFRLTERAKEMRKNMTPEEQKLWYGFLRNYPVRIARQRIIHSYIADFYCSAAKPVIEVDGSQHYSAQGLAYDAERTAVFPGFGIRVIRFTNGEVRGLFQDVCNRIDDAIQENIARVEAEKQVIERECR